MWKRLISCPHVTRECIPLVTTILSAGSKAMVNMAEKLREDDAQTFINRVAEVPSYAPSPWKNGPAD